MFEAIINFFYIIIYQPLFNSLVLLYEIIPGKDFGIAIIALTLLIKTILFPASLKAVKSQKSLQKIQPKIAEAQKKYKDDKEKQAREIMEIYRTEKINPFSGLLLALIQVPILIGLYRVFWDGLNPAQLSALYSFIPQPGNISHMFLGLLDLSKPSIIFAVLAGLTQYLQTKTMMVQKPAKGEKGADFAEIMQKQMMYVLPVFTVLILFSLPSALGLYWIVSGIFSSVQQYFIFKKNNQEK